MADLSSHGPASFWTQADALLRKNLIFQKRNVKTNIRLTIIPLLLCVLLVVIQTIINNELDKPENKCGCACIDTNGDGQCEQVCGIEYSDLDQAFRCAIPQPPEWPPILQVPEPQYRAVQTDFLSFSDLPNESCKSTGSCPASILLTGNNRTLAQSLALNMFPTSFSFNPNDVWYSLANNVLGSASGTESTNYLEPAFSSDLPVYQVQSQCAQNSTFSVSFPLGSTEIQQDITCVRGLHLWRNSSTEVNDELYYGFRKGNSERKINELIAAYDFLNTDGNNFNLNVWYNASYKNDSGNQPITLTRVPRSINMASNSYLQFLIGPAARMVFEFTKEMPKHDLELRLDFSSLLGPLFFSWVIVQLFPVVLIAIVYEREHRLRIMMKMHGLNDGPYWMISYAYFLVLSSVYMLCFVVFGSVIGLKFFTLNSYSIQFVFYFIYINLQVVLAFLVAPLFSNTRTAAVLGYLIVFGSGLLGNFLFQFFLQDPSFPRGWITVMELYPGFAVFRGLYELADYAFTGNYMGIDGMRWKDLSDDDNGMKVVLIIMFVEWLVVLFVAYYVDQVLSSGKHPLFFLKYFQNRSSGSPRTPSLLRQGSKVFVQMEKPDVLQEVST
ncbi:hypothetical protein Leryth_021480 [Lithospermum erythrorhizon]|nr:hypothetical protein Leryth_021480 [Lithospermum erythrorhizon]